MGNLVFVVISFAFSQQSRKSESDLHRVEDRDVEDLPGEDFHRKLFESLDAACKETGQVSALNHYFMYE